MIYFFSRNKKQTAGKAVCKKTKDYPFPKKG